MIGYTITIGILNRDRCSTVIRIKRIVDAVTICVSASRYNIGYAITICIIAFYRIRNTITI